MKTRFDRRAKTLLVRKGLLTEDQAAAAAAAAVAQRKPFVATLIEMGFIDEPTFISCIALEMNVPPIDLRRIKPQTGVVRSICREEAEYWCALPIARIGNILTVAVENPFDILRLDDIRMSTNCDIRSVVSEESTIRKQIAVAYDAPYLNTPRYGDSLPRASEPLKFDGEGDVARGIAMRFGLPFILASDYDIDAAMADILPVKRMRENGLVVLDRIGIALIAAIAGIVDETVLAEIERRTDCILQPLVTLASEVARCLERFPKSS